MKFPNIAEKIDSASGKFLLSSRLKYHYDAFLEILHKKDSY